MDNVFSTSLYNDFVNQARLHNLKILNEGNNMLKDDSALWSHEDLDLVLNNLNKSGAKVVLVFCFTADIKRILIRMHELGYDKVQYVYIAVGWLVDELIN